MRKLYFYDIPKTTLCCIGHQQRVQMTTVTVDTRILQILNDILYRELHKSKEHQLTTESVFRDCNAIDHHRRNVVILHISSATCHKIERQVRTFY